MVASPCVCTESALAGLFVQLSMHGGMALTEVCIMWSGLGWHMPEQGAAKRAMWMLAFCGGPALLVLGVGAWAIPGLFMLPSMDCGMAHIVVYCMMLDLGWHIPEQGAATRAMPMLTFFRGLALLLHGVGAWAIPGFVRQPSMHCGMAPYRGGWRVVGAGLAHARTGNSKARKADARFLLWPRPAHARSRRLGGLGC